MDLKQVILLGPARLGGSENWLELFIQGRVIYLISDRWATILRVDFSGFGC